MGDLDDLCKADLEFVNLLAECKIAGRDHLPEARKDGFWICELLRQV
jgi:hypothetical protein